MKRISEGEFNLEKLYSTMINYKWLILLFTIITATMMFIHLYFTPSVYSSNAILEVKSKKNAGMPNDLLFSAFSMGGTGQINKEIEILKTFTINDQALNKVDFKTRYYKDEAYKSIELYQKVPIEIKDITILNRNIIGKEFILYPKSGGFSLVVKESFPSSIFSDSSLKLNKDTTYDYNKEIINEAFKLTIYKKSKITKPIHFKIYGDNRTVYDKIISKNLNIIQMNKSAPLIKISYQDTIPSRANDYINALTGSFIEQSIILKNEQNNKLLSFIDEQLEKIKGNLETSENKYENYKVVNKIIEPSVQATAYIQELSSIGIKISENRLKEKLVQNLIDFTKHNKNLDSIAPSLMELNDRPTLQLITSLQALQLKEENLLTEYTNAHPQLIAIRKQMHNIRKKILLNIKNLKNNIVQNSSLLISKKQSYENKIKKLPTEEKTLVNIKRDYEVSSTMYNYLLQKRTENEMLIVSTLSDYTVLEQAHASDIAVKPKRALMMMVAMLLGLLMGIVTAVILAGMNKKIKNREDLKSLTDLPLYGIIPYVKQKNIKLEVYNHSNSHFTESFRALRSHLKSKEKGDNGEVILVTSTIGGEGKSMVTANLGAIFQTAGYKTILINLDLRKPTLHTYFNLYDNKGMASYLSGKEHVNEIVFATKYEHLHLIASGEIPDNPAELILSDKLPKLLSLLKKQYDYIIIDTAPIGLVNDTVHLMEETDINLIVVRENYADKSFIDGLDEIIEKNNLDNIGLVLNSSNSKSSKSAYGYGYGYGYGIKTT